MVDASEMRGQLALRLKADAVTCRASAGTLGCHHRLAQERRRCSVGCFLAKSAYLSDAAVLEQAERELLRQSYATLLAELADLYTTTNIA